MRQFYDEERIFRITGEQGQNLYLPFSGAALRPAPVKSLAGVELAAGNRCSTSPFRRPRNPPSAA